LKLKTVTARSMAQALALVRRDLGAGAVVLHTRQYRSGGIMGIGAKQMVEVTAADGMEIGRRNAAAFEARRPGTATARRKLTQPDHAGDLIRRTYRAAQAELKPKAQPQPAPQPVPQPAPQPAASAAAPDELAQEMRAVKRLVERMVHRDDAQAAKPDLPDVLFDQYLELLKREVTEDLARQIVGQVQQGLGSDEIDDKAKVRSAIQDAVADLIPTDSSQWQIQRSADGRPRVIALIGPTGVGKTTTIAKLAATFKLKHAKNVGLITMDTYRIAAVDQLRTYAQIIGLPLHVATSPEQIRSALNKTRGCDMVLIDTAGRSQRDDPRLEQLKLTIDAAQPHEVHLVLASTCTQSVLLDAIERFSAIGTDRIIFTKLDEAVSFGVLLNVMHKVDKQLSYVTTGQEVPHQIEPGESRRLAQLVLGESI
jgi:flagellar biosynthesis protein FlhF